MSTTTSTVNPASAVNPKWSEIKTDLKKSWSKLSDSDLDHTKGDMKEINVLIQKNYGQTQETYSKKINDIFHSFDSVKTPVVEPVVVAKAVEATSVSPVVAENKAASDSKK